MPDTIHITGAQCESANGNYVLMTEDHRYYFGDLGYFNKQSKWTLLCVGRNKNTWLISGEDSEEDEGNYRYHSNSEPNEVTGCAEIPFGKRCWEALDDNEDDNSNVRVHRGFKSKHRLGVMIMP